MTPVKVSLFSGFSGIGYLTISSCVNVTLHYSKCTAEVDQSRVDFEEEHGALENSPTGSLLVIV